MMRVSRLDKLLACLVIVVVCILGVMRGHDVYVWHQVEKQALAADLVEGDQE